VHYSTAPNPYFLGLQSLNNMPTVLILTAWLAVPLNTINREKKQ